MNEKYYRLIVFSFIGLIIGITYGTITLIPKYSCEARAIREAWPNKEICSSLTRIANYPQISLVELVIKNGEKLLLENKLSLVLLNGIIFEIIGAGLSLLIKKKKETLETVTKSRTLIKRY